MKKYIFLALSILTILSCKKNKTKTADFIIQNATNKQIVVRSCAYSRTMDGGATNNCLTDNISSGTSQSIRALEKNDAENVKVDDMFEVLEISRNGIKTGKNTFDDALWIKTVSDSKVEYILTVDSTFF
jgi:hypothetical protein